MCCIKKKLNYIMITPRLTVCHPVRRIKSSPAIFQDSVQDIVTMTSISDINTTMTCEIKRSIDKSFDTRDLSLCLATPPDVTIGQEQEKKVIVQSRRTVFLESFYERVEEYMKWMRTILMRKKDEKREKLM